MGTGRPTSDGRQLVRSDIAPVLELGGAGVHVPYHVTWALEHAEISEAHPRLARVTGIREAPAAIAALAADGMSVDWPLLRREAVAMTRRSYAPYSGVLVGAAGVTGDGRLVRGCNVENASYGVTLCAECGLVSDLVGTGGGTLVAVAIVAGDGRPLAPCGRCRQVLYEHGGAGLLSRPGRRGADHAGRPPPGRLRPRRRERAGGPVSFSAVDIIRGKRDGRDLSDEEIRWFLGAYTDGTVADEQASALLMAIFFRGLDARELAAWTDAMIRTGDRLDLSSVARATVDKHSTGGVGDKISLPLCPLVAALRRRGAAALGPRPRPHRRHARQARGHPGLRTGLSATRSSCASSPRWAP